MLRSPDKVVSGGGIVRHPSSTWLATYDIDTLERLSFDPAPNPGVFPTYGFAVESDEEFSYLFANTNMLNFAREGGFDNGPHSATKMYLARVPRGSLDALPRYWDGVGWSDDPSVAAIISQRFWAENTMQPRRFGDRWVSVVRRDGFFGNEIVIDVADEPWGPWREVKRIPHEGRDDSDIPRNSYHPVIAPWSSPGTGLVMIVSENAQEWSQAYDAIDVYRPSGLRGDWPFDEEESISGDSVEVD